jgi:phosphoglycolate phosphatase
MVLAFAREAGLAPGDVAVVGDNPHDMEMARAAGAVAIGVTSGNSTADDLAALADVVLPGVTALPEWLDANAG